MQAPTGTAPSTQPPRALIVDDDADIRDVLGLLLREDGFVTSLCPTLQQAIAQLDAETFDLLITDRRLSGGDGLDLIRYVLQRPADGSGGIRIILLTAARPPVAEAELPLLREASVQVIGKPFDIDQILEKARALTGWPGQPSP
jgi:two-component system, NtrC family, response regulator PilR